jgi:glycosyltransferase involved in cell wall biosynthesis
MTPRQPIALFLPSLDGGGAERVMVGLANEFAARGLPVDLLVASARGPYLAEVAPGTKLVDLGARRVTWALPRLVRYLRAERPRVLLSALDNANVVALLAARAAGRCTRCVISMRAVPSAVYPADGSMGSRKLFWAMRQTYRRADAVIANSSAVAADLVSALGVPASLIRVIHNPLNLALIESLAAEPAGADEPAPDGPPVVLGVGALIPVKDFATLVRAFARVRAQRPCRLVILGEGPERQRLAALATQCGVGDDVSLPGFRPNPFPAMRRARLFVSSSRTEGCPNALLQALALGTPVISTDSIGGAAEVLEQGRWGRLVPVGDIAAMAGAIADGLDRAPSRDGARRAQDFSHERITDRFLEVLLPGVSFA